MAEILLHDQTITGYLNCRSVSYLGAYVSGESTVQCNSMFVEIGFQLNIPRDDPSEIWFFCSNVGTVYADDGPLVSLPKNVSCIFFWGGSCLC